jgi:hypothetical protein
MDVPLTPACKQGNGVANLVKDREKRFPGLVRPFKRISNIAFDAVTECEFQDNIAEE